MFDRNVSFSTANSELRAKALRALYGLKNSIVKNSLSYKSISTLFDALVKPVLLYGCQIIAPHYKTINYLSKSKEDTSSENFLRYIAQDHYEKFHLKFIKWSLSVHSKASNLGCWGDSGRYPLFFEAIKLALDYFEHVSDCYNNNDCSLLAASFAVQKELNLDWYSNILKLKARFTSNSVPHTPTASTRKSTLLAECMRQEFVKHWKQAKNASPKLEFYNQIKENFATEEYLSKISNPQHRASFTRLRISAHNLYVERGRYETPAIPREDRWCIYCYFNYGHKCIEDEHHVLL